MDNMKKERIIMLNFPDGNKCPITTSVNDMIGNISEYYLCALTEMAEAGIIDSPTDRDDFVEKVYNRILSGKPCTGYAIYTDFLKEYVFDHEELLGLGARGIRDIIAECWDLHHEG